MDYIERMQKSGLLDFDDVNTRIKEHDNLRKAVIEESEEVKVDKKTSTAVAEDSTVVDSVNSALSKVQKQSKKRLKEMQTVIKALSSKVESLEKEVEILKRRPTPNPKSQQQSPSAQAHEQAPQSKRSTDDKPFKPKFSDYSSDDVKVQDIFNVNK